jgi:uncharacterized protein (TIGR02217 family)
MHCEVITQLGGHSLQIIRSSEGIGGHANNIIYIDISGIVIMSFNEVRFPDNISFGAIGGPGYDISITKTAGGYEKRSLVRNDGFAKYDVSHNIKTRTQLNELIAWFRAHKGKTVGFRFKDWNDYQLADEVIGTGDDAENMFQITKTYTIGACSEVRIIYKIVTGTVTVKINGAEQEEDVDFNLNYNTGMITFTNPPALGEAITVTCEFDVPVRFGIDRMEASIEGPEIFNWGQIILEEVKQID